MKKTFVNKLLMVAGLLGFASLYSVEQSTLEKQGHCINEKQMEKAYSLPARFDVNNSWDTFFTASFIYWQARQGSLDLTRIEYNTSRQVLQHDPSSPITDVIRNFSFDYEPGFKVGLGINLMHDDWVLYSEYTRLHGKSDRTVINPTPFGDPSSNLSPLFHRAVTDYETVTGTYDARCDFIDLQLSRPFYSGTQLTIDPHFGLRGGWITQHVNSYNHFYDIDPNIGLEEIFYTYSKSWFVGPRIGFNGSWLLGKGFRICGNLSGGLYYQHIKAYAKSFDEVVTRPGEISTWNRHILTQLAPSVESGIGFAWGMYLGNHGYHLDFSALYDFTYFWNQGAIRTLFDESFNSVKTNPAGFFLHGLTINTRFDF
jgi:hypothetical protein